MNEFAPVTADEEIGQPTFGQFLLLCKQNPGKFIRTPVHMDALSPGVALEEYDVYIADSKGNLFLRVDYDDRRLTERRILVQEINNRVEGVGRDLLDNFFRGNLTLGINDLKSDNPARSTFSNQHITLRYESSVEGQRVNFIDGVHGTKSTNGSYMCLVPKGEEPPGSVELIDKTNAELQVLAEQLRALNPQRVKLRNGFQKALSWATGHGWQ